MKPPLFKRHTLAVSRIVSALAVLAKPVFGGDLAHIFVCERFGV